MLGAGMASLLASSFAASREARLGPLQCEGARSPILSAALAWARLNRRLMRRPSVEPIPAETRDIPGDAYGAEPPPGRPGNGQRVLYHYTNESGLLGIVSTGALHATVARYLNDASEIMHAFQIAARYATELSRAVGTGDVRDGLDKFVEYVREVGNVEPNICIVSFSEDPNVLSQWRGYGGYSMGFDFDLMSETSDGWRLLQCRYTHSEQRLLVGAAIDQSIQEVATSSADPAYRSDVLWSTILGRVGQIAPAIKHHDFQEEREWRLVSPPIVNTELKTRVGRNSLVQYAVKPLPRRGDGTLPIGEVVVGPGPHQRRAISGVAALLSSQSDVAAWSVEGSQTPFLP